MYIYMYNSTEILSYTVSRLPGDLYSRSGTGNGRAYSSCRQPAGSPGKTIQLPLSFIENQGQAPDEVKFHASAAGHTISFTPGAIILRMDQGEDGTAESAEWTMTSPGASALPDIAGLDRQPGNANFFLGKGATDLNDIGRLFKDLQ